MNSEIITTGSELMNGSTLDTNSNYIMTGLYRVGIETDYSISIPDDLEIMKKTIRDSISRARYVYIIGGLGPTDDDMTEEIVRAVIEENFSEDLKEENFFSIKNHLGTADGVRISSENKDVFLLPGPPREMKPMFDESLDYIKTKLDVEMVIETINCIGLGESYIEPVLKEISREGVELLTYPKDLRVDVQVKYKKSLPKEEVESLYNDFNAKLGHIVYGYNHKNLESILVQELITRNETVSIAESCTGGLVADKITDIAGASNVLKESYITYSKEAKSKILNIDSSLIQEFGVVNRETTEAMVKGLSNLSESHLCLSITGVAGPGQDGDGNPEGLVYIGVKYRDKLYVLEKTFKGNRKTIKSLASKQALIEAIKTLRSYS